MKVASLITAAFFISITTEYSIAQSSGRPAPTGQIGRPASGQSARPFAGYQPKPTGQIAPAGAVQVSGAPVTAQPAQVAQPGQVPKVSTNQDPRTFPERYQPDAAAQPQQVTTTLETEVTQRSQQGTTNAVNQPSATTPVQTSTNATVTQPTAPAQPAMGTQPVNSTQPSNAQRSPSQIQSIPAANQSQGTAAPKRMDPK